MPQQLTKACFLTTGASFCLNARLASNCSLRGKWMGSSNLLLQNCYLLQTLARAGYLRHALACTREASAMLIGASEEEDPVDKAGAAVGCNSPAGKPSSKTAAAKASRAQREHSPSNDFSAKCPQDPVC